MSVVPKGNARVSISSIPVRTLKVAIFADVQRASQEMGLQHAKVGMFFFLCSAISMFLLIRYR